MLSLSNYTSLFFYIQFVYFLFAAVLSFTIPGCTLLLNIDLKKHEKLIIGTTLGIVLWTLQGIIFDFFNLRWLTYLYIFAFFSFFIIKNFSKYSSKDFKFKKHLTVVKKLDLINFILIVLGSLAIVSYIFVVGMQVPGGITFCCGQVPDNIMHIAYINELTHRFPPYESGAYGVVIKNYHYLSHLVVANLIQVFNLPLFATSFQYMPILLSVLMGLLLVVISNMLRIGKSFIRFLLFFFYFGGDFIYLLSIIFGKGLNFSYAPIETGVRYWINYPLAFSIPILLGGIALFIIWLQKKTFYTGFLYAIVFGTLIGFKVYTGIFALSGLAFLSLYFIIRKEFKYVIYSIIAIIISLIIYIPVNSGAGGLYFTGFWKVENFIESSPLGLSHLELARQVYLTHHNWPRIIEYEVIFTILFLIATFGTKLLGIFQTKKTLSFFPIELNILFIGGILSCFLAGMFFIQNSGGANSVFFLIEIFIVISFYSALACMNIFSKLNNIFKILFVFLVITLTIPISAYEALNAFYGGFHSTATVSQKELQALNYIRTNTPNNAIFIVDPKLTLDYQTPYVSFLADRPMYLSGQLTELGEHDIKLPERVKNSKTIFTNTNQELVKQILNANNISYIYLPSTEILPCCINKSFLKIIYDNKLIKVIKVIPK